MMDYHYVTLSEVLGIPDRRIRRGIAQCYSGWNNYQMSLRDWTINPQDTIGEEPVRVTDFINEYGEDILLLDLNNNSTDCKCHLGFIPDIYNTLARRGYRLKTLDYQGLLEKAREKACENTISVPDDKYFRINRLWQHFKDITVALDEINLGEIIKVERELIILERDAVLEPWSLVQSKFSFGTLKERT